MFRFHPSRHRRAEHGVDIACCFSFRVKTSEPSCRGRYLSALPARLPACLPACCCSRARSARPRAWTTNEPGSRFWLRALGEKPQGPSSQEDLLSVHLSWSRQRKIRPIPSSPFYAFVSAPQLPAPEATFDSALSTRSRVPYYSIKYGLRLASLINERMTSDQVACPSSPVSARRQVSLFI